MDSSLGLSLSEKRARIFEQWQASQPELVPPVPIGDTDAARMSDEAIAAELDALNAWQGRYLTRGGQGPTLPSEMVWEVVWHIGGRRGKLLDVQRLREGDAHHRAVEQAEAERKAALLARAHIGAATRDGKYPVSVNGHNVGIVKKLGRKWVFHHLVHGGSPDLFGTRADAVAALVARDDLRREQAEEAVQQEQARHVAPEGWVFGDSRLLAENDVIRVPRTRNDRDGRPYPIAWPDPVRVTSVRRNDNGSMVVSLANLDGSRAAVGSLLWTRPEQEASFVWAHDRTTPLPTPHWVGELRCRMADIGDDIETIRRREGLSDYPRIGRLADLIALVSRNRTTDLQQDLQHIHDEILWLEAQFANPDLPYETRNRKSWASAALHKAEWAIHEFDDVAGSSATAAPAPAPVATAEIDAEVTTPAPSVSGRSESPATESDSEALQLATLARPAPPDGTMRSPRDAAGRLPAGTTPTAVANSSARTQLALEF
ncbi:hypothetical protein ACWDUL_20640 [Nocardia niigatensis]